MAPKRAPTRTVWRVLADPPEDSPHFSESWHSKAHAAYLVARSMEADGLNGVEVNRVVLRAKVSRIDLLNHCCFMDEVLVVPVEEWRSPNNRSKRAARGRRRTA